jgi:hypothetical protein
MSSPLDEMVAAGPWPERLALRALLSLGRRPRGRVVLALLPAADQAVWSLLAMGRYDDPAVASQLGWDADTVVERGRALRIKEGRP